MKYIRPQLINDGLMGYTSYSFNIRTLKYYLRLNFPNEDTIPDIISYSKNTLNLLYSANVAFIDEPEDRTVITYHCETGPAVTQYFGVNKS